MTREESAANAARNEVIRRCEHHPRLRSDGSITCAWCGCRFAAMMLPVLMEFPPFDPEDEE